MIAKLIIFVISRSTVWTHKLPLGQILMILDLATGYPGSLHDSRVLRNNNIFWVAENGDVLSSSDDITENARTSPLILGNNKMACYSL